jgi:ankyrin repeat protein
MVKLLLAHGADVNANASGKTPLAIVFEKGHHEVASLLRQHGGKE